MTIIKKGNDTEQHFTCGFCRCEFTARIHECICTIHENKLNTEYMVSAECPCCEAVTSDQHVVR